MDLNFKLEDKISSEYLPPSKCIFAIVYPLYSNIIAALSAIPFISLIVSIHFINLGISFIFLL